MNNNTNNRQLTKLMHELDKARNDQGFWEGYLSSSALGTAVSVAALKITQQPGFENNIVAGLNWLFAHQNSDGGFGDSPDSESNLSTTLLSYAAIRFCGANMLDAQSALDRTERYLRLNGIQLSSASIAQTILDFYGKDLTFSVPILAMLSICEVTGPEGFDKIPDLPFELSLLPDRLFRFFNLQVVSYAIPALIAVGIAIHKHKNKQPILLKTIRVKAIPRALKKLSNIQPESGGFLEAIPLTAFSILCLISSGFSNHKVVNSGLEFLTRHQREDGSWPIDANLSTWVTTLSIKAFGEKMTDYYNPEAVAKLRSHLINTQYKTTHPFNKAAAGGWGWTNLPGAVPDADDTAGAVLALLQIYDDSKAEKEALIAGCGWLVCLQNRDGGLPTFCKGWGRLPFDASCADITGHAIAAVALTMKKLHHTLPEKLKKQWSRFLIKGVRYLKNQQNTDGSWLPLWFGSQLAEDKKNGVYGTARVCTYLHDMLVDPPPLSGNIPQIKNMISNGVSFLVKQQNEDGSWGCKYGAAGTIEETALAISALVSHDKSLCQRGADWLQKEYDASGAEASPIGLYFAALWYSEKLYPLTFYIEALRRLENA